MQPIPFSTAEEIAKQFLLFEEGSLNGIQPEVITVSLLGVFVASNYFNYPRASLDNNRPETDVPFVRSREYLEYAKRSLVALPNDRVVHWHRTILILASVCQPYSSLRSTFHKYFGAVRQPIDIIRYFDAAPPYLSSELDREIYTEYLRVLYTIQEFPLSSPLNHNQVTSQLRALLDRVHAGNNVGKHAILACLTDLLIVSHTMEDADCVDNNLKALSSIEAWLSSYSLESDVIRGLDLLVSTHIVGFPYYMLRFCRIQLHLLNFDYGSVYHELISVGCHAEALDFLALANQTELAVTLLLKRISVTLGRQYEDAASVFLDFPSNITKESTYSQVIASSLKEPFLHYILLLAEIADNPTAMHFVSTNTTRLRFRAASDLGLWHLQRHQQAKDMDSLVRSLRYYSRALAYDPMSITVKERCGMLYLQRAQLTHRAKRRERYLEKAYSLFKDLCESSPEQYRFHQFLGAIALKQDSVLQALFYFYSACRTAVSGDQIDTAPFLAYLTAIHRVPLSDRNRINVDELAFIVQFLWGFQERKKTDASDLVTVGFLVLRALLLIPALGQSKTVIVPMRRWRVAALECADPVLTMLIAAVSERAHLD